MAKINGKQQTLAKWAERRDLVRWIRKGTPRRTSKGRWATGCSSPVFLTQHDCRRITDKAWLKWQVPRRDASNDITGRLDSPNVTTEFGLGAPIEVGKEMWFVEDGGDTAVDSESRRHKES